MVQVDLDLRGQTGETASGSTCRCDARAATVFVRLALLHAEPMPVRNDAHDSGNCSEETDRSVGLRRQARNGLIARVVFKIAATQNEPPCESCASRHVVPEEFRSNRTDRSVASAARTILPGRSAGGGRPVRARPDQQTHEVGAGRGEGTGEEVRPRAGTAAKMVSRRRPFKPPARDEAAAGSRVISESAAAPCSTW